MAAIYAALSDRLGVVGIVRDLSDWPRTGLWLVVETRSTTMQELIVYFIVLGAAAYLGRTLWSAASGKKSGCNSCGTNCASQKSSTPAPQQLVQIDLHHLNGKR